MESKNYKGKPKGCKSNNSKLTQTNSNQTESPQLNLEKMIILKMKEQIILTNQIVEIGKWTKIGISRGLILFKPARYKSSREMANDMT